MGIKGFISICWLGILFCRIVLYHEWERNTDKNLTVEIILENFLLDLYAVLIFNNKCILGMHLCKQQLACDSSNMYNNNMDRCCSCLVISIKCCYK